MKAVRYLTAHRPKAKWCYWCKSYKPCMLDLLGESHPSWICKSDNMVMTTRQHKKCIREQEFRYCRNYRFSIKRFREWKKECKGELRWFNL
jgi:hypothetical protein